MAWDVLSGGAKMAWDVLSGLQKLHGMFCPGWQIDAGCFVQGVKKWHGMFFPGMFCPTFFIKGLLLKCKYVYLNAVQTTFIMEDNHMNPNQTAPKEGVNLVCNLL